MVARARTRRVDVDGAARRGAGESGRSVPRRDRSGRATAPLVGGCLWLLRETLATPWEVELDGCILFFEDVHCPPWHLDGMLTQLRNAGKLERVAGVAVGEFAESDPTKERNPWLRSKSFEDVLEEHLEPLGVPVLFNFPLGHGEHLATIPLGVTATIDADGRKLTIEEPALEPAPGLVAATGRNRLTAPS